MNQADIDNRFSFHTLGDVSALDDVASVRENCRQLADFLSEKLPESREKSLAITHLEEVMFWSNAAIARNQ